MATSLSSSSSSSSSSSATMELTDKEAEQYDRQIRLWGAEAQKRMRNSCMLIIGCNGLGAEIIKNIVLAGISIIIIDDQFVQENDLETQFFLTQSDIGQNVCIVVTMYTDYYLRMAVSCGFISTVFSLRISLFSTGPSDLLSFERSKYLTSTFIIYYFSLYIGYL